MNLDPNLPPGALIIPAFSITGEVTHATVRDPGHVPNRVVDPTKPFTVDVEWKLEGGLVPLWLAAMNQNWLVQAYAESMGPGPEVTLGSSTVPKGNFSSPAANVFEYSTTITVPANTLTEHLPDSGIYKVVASVFLNSSVPGPFDIAGFYEAELIKAENPE